MEEVARPKCATKIGISALLAGTVWCGDKRRWVEKEACCGSIK